MCSEPLGDNGAMPGSVIALRETREGDNPLNLSRPQALYSPVQLTWSFQSMNEPFGLLRQAHT
jgi:hypothetical protein